MLNHVLNRFLNGWRPSLLPAGLRGQRGWSVEECASFAAALNEIRAAAAPLSGQEGSDDGASTRPQPLSSAAATAQQVNRCWWWDCDAQRTGSCCSAGVQWAKCSSATQCSAQRTAPCGTASTNEVQPLNVGYHLHCAVAPICQRHPWFSFLGLHCTIATSCFALSAKRDSGERPSSGCSSSSEAASAASHPPVQHRRGQPEKRRRGGQMAGFLLR